MFRDERKRDIWNTLRQYDLQALNRLLPDSLVEEAAAKAGVPVGAGALNAVTLLWLALLSAVDRGKSFACVIQTTLKLLHDLRIWNGQPSPGLLPKARRKSRSDKARAGGRRSRHDPRGGDPNLVSEEAFVQARKRMPPAFWITLVLLLGACFEKKHGRMLRWKKYRLLALDGTTINLPGRQSLARHFGVSSNQHGGAVQARMVMLQFPLTRLPWRYTLAPRSQGETTLAGPLLDQLQPDDLVLMDRGFFAYGLFWRIQQRGAFFAVRLTASVKLKKVKNLGCNDRLVSWTPADHGRKWKQYPPSIQLRVIGYQIKGFRPGAIVTNATDPNQISRQDWVRLTTGSQAGRHLDVGLYHRRWEIETTFFELKVEQEMEGKLRGRTPECIEYEIAGHVILYLLTRWLMVEAALESGNDPLRLSFVEATREMNDLRAVLLASDEKYIARTLIPLLLERIASHEVPWRPGRYDPRPGDAKARNRGHGKYSQPSRLPKIET